MHRLPYSLPDCQARLAFRNNENRIGEQLYPGILQFGDRGTVVLISLIL
jgi:hypothetical protein